MLAGVTAADPLMIVYCLESFCSIDTFDYSGLFTSVDLRREAGFPNHDHLLLKVFIPIRLLAPWFLK